MAVGDAVSVAGPCTCQRSQGATTTPGYAAVSTPGAIGLRERSRATHCAAGDTDPVSDQYVTACHEASHASWAFSLRATQATGPVTIIPIAGYDGICFAGRTALPRASDRQRINRSWPAMPARLRRFYEASAMIFLAGEIGEQLYAPRGHVEQPVKHVGTDLSPPVPARELAMIDQVPAACDTPADLNAALIGLTYLHAGDETAAELHLAMLSQKTGKLLATERAGVMVTVLAAQLVQHKTLSAARWRSILMAAG
jgi:hypothetical protein